MHTNQVPSAIMAMLLLVLFLHAAPPSFTLEYKLDPRFTEIGKDMAAGSFIAMDDGSLLQMDSKDGGTVRISRDDGKTWAPFSKMYDGPGPGKPTQDWETGLALKTKDGVIVWVYRDFKNRSFEWNHKTNDAVASCDVWSIRSLDGGRTWVDRQRMFEGYTGAIINIIQTSDGNIVVPVQRLLHDPGRHAQCTFVSPDNAKHWIRSNIIDLGGSGHHDGCIEGSVVELKDGRLYMIMRTNMDRFWEAFSWDGGITWLQIQPSQIFSTSSPGFITRLHDGRLALIWTNLPQPPRSLTEINLFNITEYTTVPQEPGGASGKTKSMIGPGAMRSAKRHDPPGKEPDIAPLATWPLIPDDQLDAYKKKWPEMRWKTGGGSDYSQRLACWSRNMLSLAFSEDDGKTWGEPIVFERGNMNYCQLWERRPGELWISMAIGPQRVLIRANEAELTKGK